MPTTPRRRSQKGFTMVEVLTVIVIIGVLAAILIPVVGKARATARSSHCLSNLRQIGAAFTLYAQEHDQALPAPQAADGTYWFWALQPYTGTKVDPVFVSYNQLNPVFQCPEWSLGHTAWGFGIPDIGYSMSATLSGTNDAAKAVPLVRISMPSQTVLVLENYAWTNPYFPQAGQPMSVLKSGLFAAPQNLISGASRHDSHANYLFVDGHVKSYNPDAAEKLLPDD